MCTYMCLDSRVLAPFYIVGIVEMVGYILTTEAALLTRDQLKQRTSSCVVMATFDPSKIVQAQKLCSNI